MKKKPKQLKWQAAGFSSQSAYHRSRKRACGLCLAHGCYNHARIAIHDGKIVHKYAYCAEHSTRKSRGFE